MLVHRHRTITAFPSHALSLALAFVRSCGGSPIELVVDRRVQVVLVLVGRGCETVWSVVGDVKPSLHVPLCSTTVNEAMGVKVVELRELREGGES